MKEFKSDIFGSIPEPENFAELVGMLSEYKVIGRGVRMWRGQSNIQWPLHHSAYRRLSLRKSEISESHLLNYEGHLLEQATHRGYRNWKGRNLTDFELLALLQHHGAATRLMDFSRSALIALWFAVKDDSSLRGVLIGINTYFIGGYESEDCFEFDNYEEEFKSIAQYDHPFTWEPTNVTPRVAAQHSQFVYSALSDKKTGSLLLKDDPEANVFISLSPNLKKECDRILERTFDIRYQTLFPDIDGFGKSNSHLTSTDRMWRW